MSTLDKDQVIEKFSEAYEAAHGKKPSIEAKGGWYSVDGGKNVRLAALEDMTTELSSANAPAKKAAPKKAAKSEKPAAKKTDKKAEKAPAAKKTAKAKKPKKAAKSKGGFSVKEFWNEQIDARNPGSKHPR